MQMTALDMALSWGAALRYSVVGFAIVLAILAVIALLIKLLSAVVNAFVTRGEKKKAAPESKNADKEAKTEKTGEPLPETRSEGSLVLTDVDEPTAAVIMAIVSDTSGIPLNRLSFKSIKLIKED